MTTESSHKVPRLARNSLFDSLTVLSNGLSCDMYHRILLEREQDWAFFSPLWWTQRLAGVEDVNAGQWAVLWAPREVSSGGLERLRPGDRPERRSPPARRAPQCPGNPAGFPSSPSGPEEEGRGGLVLVLFYSLANTGGPCAKKT